MEQAIFTSVRSGQNAGYQLAATSPGVSRSEARELSQWGPGHDSVYPDQQRRGTISFRAMESGAFCIGYTVLAGVEYSARGGERVYTQFFLLQATDLERFAASPFRILEAVIAAGRVQVLDPLPKELETVPLVGRASAVSCANLERINRQVGAHKLATLLHAALVTPSLGITTELPPERVLTALLDLLPVPHRLPFSLTTGLKVSARRPFRIHILPDSDAQKRLGVRQLGMTPISLVDDPPARLAPDRGWSALMHELLEAEQYQAVASIMEQTASTREADLNVLAESVRRQLDQWETAAATPSWSFAE